MKLWGCRKGLDSFNALGDIDDDDRDGLDDDNEWDEGHCGGTEE